MVGLAGRYGLVLAGSWVAAKWWRLMLHVYFRSRGLVVMRAGSGPGPAFRTASFRRALSAAGVSVLSMLMVRWLVVGNWVAVLYMSVVVGKCLLSVWSWFV